LVATGKTASKNSQADAVNRMKRRLEVATRKPQTGPIGFCHTNKLLLLPFLPLPLRRGNRV
jgi:hypothetical protein